VKGIVVRGTDRVVALCLVALALALSACGGASESAAPVQPAEITKLAGGGVEITLTADAVKRIDVRTAEVAHDGASLVIPYSAVLYDPDGATWTYTNVRPRVFVRANITVDRIVGERAILTKGPPPGTAVVTLGATELWGVEYGGIQED
jgi:hypothetical protein